MAVNVAQLTAEVRIDDRDFQEGMRRINRDINGISGSSNAARFSVEQLATALRTLPQRQLEEVDALFRRIQNYQIRDFGRNLTLGLTVPIVGVGTAVVETGMRLDALRRGLDAVTGGGKATEAQMKRLREIAKLPGIGYEEAIKASAALQAAGLSADMSERSIKAFGNALATAGKGRFELNLVNLALGQIASSTKVLGQDVRQIQQQVPQIRQIMVKAFGTADTIQLQKMGIEPQYFIRKIVEELERLPKVSSGAKNEMENLKDTLTTASYEISKNLLPSIVQLAQTATPIIINMTRAFSALPPPLQQAVFGGLALAAAFGPVVFIFGNLLDAVQKVRLALIALAATRAIIGNLTTAGPIGRGMTTWEAIKHLAFGGAGGPIAGLGAGGAGVIPAGGAEIVSSAVAGATLSRGGGAGIGGGGQVVLGALKGATQTDAKASIDTLRQNVANAVKAEAEAIAASQAISGTAGAVMGIAKGQRSVITGAIPSAARNEANRAIFMAQQAAATAAAASVDRAAAEAALAEAEADAANSAAMSAPAAASSIAKGRALAGGTGLLGRIGGGLRGLGAGALGLAGRVFTGPMGLLTIPAAAIGVSQWANQVTDARKGKQDVSWEDTFGELGLNPWYHPLKEADKKNAADMAEFQKMRAAGQSPAQLAKADAAERARMAQNAKRADFEERSATEDAKYKVELNKARTAGDLDDEDTTATAREKFLKPVLEQRATALKAREKEFSTLVGKGAKDQKEYWGIIAEQQEVADQLAKLKKASAKEAERKAEQVKREERDAHVALNRAKLASGSYYASFAPEGRRAAAMLGVEKPLLQDEENYQAGVMRGLYEKAKTDPKAAKEYSEAYEAYWAAKKREGDLLKGAQDEADENKRKAHRLFTQQLNVQMTKAQGQIAGLPEDQNAQGAQAVLIPLMRQQQQDLVRDAANWGRDTMEYWNDVNEYWSIENQIGDLNRRAAAERKQNATKAKEENQKASREQLELVKLQTSLAEKQMNNNPFLTEAQKAQQLVPLLMQQYQKVLRPVKGEGEADRLRREIEGEDIKGQIMKAMGLDKGGFARTIGGGIIPMFNMKLVQSVMGQLGKIAKSARAQSPFEAMHEGGFDPRSAGPVTATGWAFPNQGNGYDPGADPYASVRLSDGRTVSKMFSPGYVGYQGEQPRNLAAQAAGGRPVVYQVVLDGVHDRETLRRELEKLNNDLAEKMFPSPY